MLKKNCLKIGLFLGGLTIAFIIFEMTVRLFGLAQQTANLYEPDSLIGLKHVPNASGLWRKKEFRTEIRINSEGFRDVDHEINKPGGVYRIIVLGDSYVEAFQLPLKDTFHKILEKRLNETVKGKKIEIMNFGVSGFGATQNYLALRYYGYKYNPDMVILTVTTGNDIRNAHPDLEMDNSKPYFMFDKNGKLYQRPFYIQKGLGLTPFVLNHIFFPHAYIYIAQTLGPKLWEYKAAKAKANAEPDVSLDSYVYIDPYPHVWEEAWRATLAVILQMKKELNEKGIKFLVVTLTDSDGQIDGKLQEYLGNKAKGKNIKWDIEKPVKILDEFCNENKINFLPLLYGFRKEFGKTHEKFHFIYDGHWNKRGHGLAAEIIYKKITAEGLIR
jgi:hypothetical protein